MNKKSVKKVEGSTMPKGSVAAEQNVKKRERKVCDFSGQKRDPPEDNRDPLRIFYETLFEQIPDSEMAQFWLMESGLLPMEVARKVYDKKQKRNKFISPVKAVSVTKKGTVSSTKTKTTGSKVLSSTKTKATDSKVTYKQSKKRKAKGESAEDDSDDDFLITKKNTKKQKTS